MNTLKEQIAYVKRIFDEETFIFEPKGLYEPIDYTLRLGGKRIRPVMLLSACEMFGGNIEETRHAAIGIETFHNFTLLHDDLMDKSPIRRGKPTVYQKWNNNTAILSGDTMFAMAWSHMLMQPHPQLQQILQTFNRTAIEVCEGQQYDMEFEQRDDVSIPEYMEMIRLKTAVLLAGALKIGALYANANTSDIENLYNFGIHLGLAFQLQDDLLDAYGNEATFGKKTGSDIRDNKKTYLWLRALQIATPEQQETLRALFKTTPEDTTEKVNTILNIYKDTNIKKEVEDIINQEFSKAENYLAKIAVDNDKKATLEELMKTLLGREK